MGQMGLMGRCELSQVPHAQALLLTSHLSLLISHMRGSAGQLGRPEPNHGGLLIGL